MAKLLPYLFLMASCWCFGQRTGDPIQVNAVTDSLIQPDYSAYLYDANRPSKAAFYSAVLPGLGQAYNGKYWKIPLAYAGIGIPVLAYISNDKEYQRLRTAFQIRLAGGTDDEFSNENGEPIVTNAGLERAQRVSQRNKELSLLIAAAFYAIQIIDANVDGHLSQFDVDRDLSFKPYLDYNQSASGTSYGFALSYTF
ncbi:DUF5683 domain-containing protein [Nonlabens agnitus]|uniref:DUF5683 domain-containing protein n=1 Tax=Nonlabens agnitus TaxID=870484 RepID=A0A2S9WSU9_9FLAO|nr:DUF5683 domain-containing protein [Nonlabens agnitus]PRP66561.1 hypothetical protein BST86_05335 [Nonlabens agnitus]